MNTKRREFLKIVGGAAMALPATVVAAKSLAWADDVKKVSNEINSRELNHWSVKFHPPLQTSQSGQLLGKTFSVKELFYCSNFPATGSTKALLPKLPNSPLIDILLNQGAIWSGKVHTHEIALGLFGWNPIAGQGLNPHDPTRLSGAAAVVQQSLSHPTNVISHLAQTPVEVSEPPPHFVESLASSQQLEESLRKESCLLVEL